MKKACAHATYLRTVVLLPFVAGNQTALAYGSFRWSTCVAERRALIVHPLARRLVDRGVRWPMVRDPRARERSVRAAARGVNCHPPPSKENPSAGAQAKDSP